jgi:hypothetical protein
MAAAQIAPSKANAKPFAQRWSQLCLRPRIYDFERVFMQRETLPHRKNGRAGFRQKATRGSA